MYCLDHERLPGSWLRQKTSSRSEYEITARVIIYFDTLRMITQSMVGRVIFIAASIPNPCTNHPFDASKLGIRTPKSAKSKRCRFDFR